MKEKEPSISVVSSFENQDDKEGHYRLEESQLDRNHTQGKIIEPKGSAFGVYDSLSYHLVLLFRGAFILYMTIVLGFQPLWKFCSWGQIACRSVLLVIHSLITRNRDASSPAVQRHETEAGLGRDFFASQWSTNAVG